MQDRARYFHVNTCFVRFIPEIQRKDGGLALFLPQETAP